MLIGKTPLAASLLSAMTLAVCAPCAAAQGLPRTAEAFALKIEAQCASAYRGLPSPLAKSRAKNWLKTLVEDQSGKVLLAQGALTRCKPASQLICGTGGCPIAVFRVAGGVSTPWLDQQVLGWSLIRENGKPVLRMDVHGSHCGDVGSTACETRLNLQTGAQRTFKPAP